MGRKRILTVMVRLAVALVLATVLALFGPLLLVFTTLLQGKARVLIVALFGLMIAGVGWALGGLRVRHA